MLAMAEYGMKDYETAAEYFKKYYSSYPKGKFAEKIGVASRNIENNIKKLKEYGIFIRHGSPKNGYWEIVDKELQE